VYVSRSSFQVYSPMNSMTRIVVADVCNEVLLIDSVDARLTGYIIEEVFKNGGE
jgi:hypothetical protein